MNKFGLSFKSGNTESNVCLDDNVGIVKLKKKYGNQVEIELTDELKNDPTFFSLTRLPSTVTLFRNLPKPMDDQSLSDLSMVTSMNHNSYTKLDDSNTKSIKLPLELSALNNDENNESSDSPEYYVDEPSSSGSLSQCTYNIDRSAEENLSEKVWTEEHRKSVSEVGNFDSLSGRSFSVFQDLSYTVTDNEENYSHGLVIGSPSFIIQLSKPTFDISKVRDQLCIVYSRYAKPDIKDNDIDEHLTSMIYDVNNANLNVWIGKKRFQVNMLVMKTYSEIFEQLDMSLPAHVELPQLSITPRAFKIIYIWMLTNDATVSRRYILEVFRGAIYLKVKNMADQLWNMIDSIQAFNEKSAFILYKEAVLVDVEQIQLLMITRICKYFLTLIASNEFLGLTITELFLLITQNSIGVNTEIEVFFAVIMWVNYDWDERSKYLLELVNGVRFKLVKPFFLVELLRDIQLNLPIIDEIDEIKKKIQDAIMYGNVKHSAFGNDLSEEEIEFLTPPVSRTWIVDPTCKYHHTKTCRKHYCIEWKLFTEYCIQLRNNPTSWKNVFIQIPGENCNCKMEDAQIDMSRYAYLFDEDEFGDY